MTVRTTVKSIQDIMRQDVGVDGDAQRISQLTWLFFLKIIDDQDQELEITRDDYRSPIPERFQWRNWAADPEGITGQAMLDFFSCFPVAFGARHFESVSGIPSIHLAGCEMRGCTPNAPHTCRTHQDACGHMRCAFRLQD
jgi:type I restriction-modification system DNA methylase subunit